MLQHFTVVVAIIIMLLISCGEGRTPILIIYCVCVCACMRACVLKGGKYCSIVLHTGVPHTNIAYNSLLVPFVAHTAHLLVTFCFIRVAGTYIGKSLYQQ